MSYRTVLLPLMLLTISILITGCGLPSKTATTGAAVSSGDLTDGEILQYLRTLNDGEIKQARLALQKSNNDQVREVADLIVQDHTRVNERIDSLLNDDLQLEKSPLSRGLKLQADGIYENLTEVSGKEFNCTFLEKQIEQHDISLESAKNDLLPDADREAISQLVKNGIPSLERHKRHAQEAHSALGC